MERSCGHNARPRIKFIVTVASQVDALGEEMEIESNDSESVLLLTSLEGLAGRCTAAAVQHSENRVVVPPSEDLIRCDGFRGHKYPT